MYHANIFPTQVVQKGSEFALELEHASDQDKSLPHLWVFYDDICVGLHPLQLPNGPQGNLNVIGLTRQGHKMIKLISHKSQQPCVTSI